MQLNEIHNPSEHASVSLKTILLVFAIVLIGTLGYLVYQQNTEIDNTDYGANVIQNSETTTQNSTAETAPADPCDFSTVTASVIPGKTFDIFGGENFSTIVCGYIHTKEQNVGMDEEIIKNVAYVAVKKFKDDAFKAKIEAGIAGEGNTVNAKLGSDYLLGCGCLEGGKIVANPEPTGGLMSLADQAKFIASTAEKPVIMKLTYEVHGGSGCTCCTLFEKAEVL